ncbi:MAG: 2-oxo acid dehydrogenase subunit E2 [Promethearchaeota archaeon]|jgi:pyruvate/2-oxoglutarate dehydrogenase complex dihydrolipoamide acyltransferase (E2) component
MGKKKDLNYELQPFFPVRRVVAETFSYFEKKHPIHLLIELDITIPRVKIKEHFSSTGEKLSLTAFIIYCVAKVVNENKLTHAFRLGKKKLIIFDDVDITAIVERFVEGEYFPNIHIIRAANKKAYNEINEEIRAAQVEEVETDKYKNLMSNYFKVPRFLRRPLGRKFIRNPFIIKKFSGTVIVTAVGMIGEGVGWGIPYPGHPLIVTVGGISKKPGIFDGNIETREYIKMTITFDHDIIDGGPATRFVSRLKELIERGFSIE